MITLSSFHCINKKCSEVTKNNFKIQLQLLKPCKVLSLHEQTSRRLHQLAFELHLRLELNGHRAEAGRLGRAEGRIDLETAGRQG
jgi:hypothetical protein